MKTPAWVEDYLDNATRSDLDPVQQRGSCTQRKTHPPDSASRLAPVSPSTAPVDDLIAGAVAVAGVLAGALAVRALSDALVGLWSAL